MKGITYDIVIFTTAIVFIAVVIVTITIPLENVTTVLVPVPMKVLYMNKQIV